MVTMVTHLSLTFRCEQKGNVVLASDDQWELLRQSSLPHKPRLASAPVTKQMVVRLSPFRVPYTNTRWRRAVILGSTSVRIREVQT